MLDFLLSSLVEQIKITRTANVFNSAKKAQDVQDETRLTMKDIIDQLYDHVIKPKETSAILLILANSLTTEGINNIKKILIYLQEQIALGNPQDLKYNMTQLTAILTQIFVRVPKASQMRDFFSFLREIFFYNNMMDKVDHALAREMLKIFNQVIQESYTHDKNQVYNSDMVKSKNQPNKALNPSDFAPHYLRDYYFFSSVTRGMLILNDLEFEKEVFVSTMFKMHLEKII